MPGPEFTSLLADPLTGITREKRRNLLVASTGGVLVGLLGLVPTRLSVLGIEFSAPAQRHFVLLVAAVVSYFLVAFLVYAVADWFVWWKKYQDHLIAVEVGAEGWSQSDQENYDDLHSRVPKMAWLYSWSGPLALVRLAFEFVFPLVVGSVSIWCLLAA